ncbi:MAG: hypothetical protein U0S12_00980 [Fimbriimonadales bacterium]
MGVNAAMLSANEIADAVRAYAAEAARRAGSPAAVKPGHRVPFHWPPPPVSAAYHVLPSDWSGQATLEAHGEKFDVAVAKTPYGVFGRCAALWHEAKGDDERKMLLHLRQEVEPLFQRQFAVSEILGLEGRFHGHFRDLDPLSLVKLLYCRDRDVAHEAMTEIEIHASLRVFGPALVAILDDRLHPFRRSAQWCVLDLFEDIRSFCDEPESEAAAVAAIKGLIWDAEDDYARTIYKAGVVLGGHLPGEKGGPVLIECLKAPSKIGRRAAIHGLFHVVEWNLASKPVVLAALRDVAMGDPEPILREYATAMAADIANGNMDHVAEPVFPDEP